MKRPDSSRWFDGKELSYFISWSCVVLACMMLFPIVITSSNAPIFSKIAVGIVLVLMFGLGVCSIITEIIDYRRYKQSKGDEQKDEGEENERQ